MYLEHFGLNESPFRITPHTEFFFTGANRGATLEALIYAITHDEGIVKVSGEVGSGKTMLCRMLLERLPEEVDTVYLANPSLSREEILYAIADDLKLSMPEGRMHAIVRTLQEHLVDIYAAGRKVVIMIDEAHAMPSETLEEIRLLSNLETNRHKLVHIVLFGQPELDDRLAETGMRQLKERITHNFALESLQRNDVGTYLMFRLRTAGYRGPDLFTPKAIQRISQASEGLTRRINILADKALLSAFSENRYQIDTREVDAAIRDAQFKPMHARKLPSGTWLAIGGGIAFVAGLAFFIVSSFPRETPPPATALVTAKAAASTPTVSAVAAEPPVTALTPAATSPAPESPPGLAERFAATDEWLKATPDSHYFIQLLRIDGNRQRDFEYFLETGVKGLDTTQLRVYRSSLSGRDRLGVIYGDFATQEAAQNELARLTNDNLIKGAYVRSVGKLK